MIKHLKSLLFILTLTLISPTSYADDWELKEVSNFAKLAQQAKIDHLPIVIYFNMQQCGACQKLKENVITPLINNGRLDGYVHMVQLTVDRNDTLLTDFYGEEPITRADFQQTYNITTLPTMVFLNPDGDVIAPAMVRSGAYDYVPYYLQQHINQALKALKNPKRIQLD